MTVDLKKVYLIVQHIKRNLEIETVFELERKGLQRICIENNIEYNELNEAEKEMIWKELLEIALKAFILSACCHICRLQPFFHLFLYMMRIICYL